MIAVQKKLIRIPYLPEPKQRVFHASTAKFRAFIGGIGSGKTTAGVNEAIKLAIQYPGSFGVIVAPTYTMLRDSTQREFFKYLPRELIKNFNKTENHLILINGSEIIFRSADDPEKLRGPNLSWFYIDEAALCTQLAWDILIGRLRLPPAKGFITTTPKGRNWVYVIFVEMRLGEIIRCSTREAPHASREFLRSLEETYSAEFAKQEIEGEFIALEGLVYDEFSREKHVVAFKGREWKEVIAGVDWGYTNPAVILVICFDSDLRAHVVDEFYERRKLINQIKEKAEEFSETYNISTFYCDPSEPQNIKELKLVGLKAKQADNAVLPGIQMVKSLLQVRDDGLPGLLIHPRCSSTIMEFENYSYPQEKDGRPIKEEPIKMFDHAMDALRYALYTHLKGPRAKVAKKKPRGW
jgi:PBSX family phage terminase large subunit